jgi:TolA-binding protein/predicted TPR repeat methyltransferase
MNLVFVESSWLWLLLAVPLFWFLPRRASDWKHATIRTAAVFFLIISLARPGLLTELEHPYQVLIWDRSESVNPSTTTAASDWFEGLPDDSRARLIMLGRDGEIPPDLRKLNPMRLDGSSIGRALGAAARLIPDGAAGAITVISDGMATDPHWGDAVRQLLERKIPVHTITVGNPENDVYPTAIHARPPIRIGQSTKVIVEIAGKAENAVVSLMEGDQLLARSKPFACETKTSVELEFEPSRAGLLPVVATLEVLSGTDPNPENNRFPSTLAVQEPIRALYLSGRLTGSRERMSTLLGPGIELSEPSQAALDELVKNPDRLTAYDLLVIDDRPEESIPRALQEAIVRAVRDEGVGLFYSGGKGVFGTGGYFDTPVASILPVEMIQKEEKRDPSTTLVVIIDTSASMTGERVQLAKECARLAIRRLLPHDKVGIIEFYGTKQWAAPIQSAANAIDIQRAINRMDAGGGTVILPAIEEAFYALQNVQTRYKHVLVLTDGGVEGGDFESLMRRMAAKGMNVSTVLVGGDAHSEFLVNIANWGKGHFYAASNRFSIPEIILKQPSTSKIPPYRKGEHLISMGGASGWWGDIPRPEKPRISGYVETLLRPGAQVTIETQVERHPVLASWRSGLGRVTALTTEPVGEGTAPWREWNGYGAWLMRVLARTSREHPQPFSYTIERSPSGARIVAQGLTARAYRPLVERIDADGKSARIDFQQRTPDLFTASILAAPSETLHLRGSAEDWPGNVAHLVSPAWQAASPELNVDPARAVDLGLLASATGGTSVPLQNSSSLNPGTGGPGNATDLLRLWPWCLMLALLAYLGDILYRRSPGFAMVRAGRTAVLWLAIGLGLGTSPEASAGISAALETQLQQTLRQEPFQVDDQSLYRAALIEDEALEPLLSRLDELRQADGPSFSNLWLAASLQWRYGNLDEALALFLKAAELRAEPLPFFRIAQILDSQGKTAEAADRYQQSLQAKPDAELAGRIQLRLALLKSTGEPVDKVEEDLAAFARKQDQAFQNRAGVVLALTGKPEEALKLYKAADAGDQVFKQLIRIAEWAIAAKDMARAQESAWGALHAATLQRDQRYALTVLAEAYRSDNKLDALISRFAAAPDLPEQARIVWIELLREKGDAGQALALFQKAKAEADKDGGFSADMRRELLDICREAGRDDLLVANFKELIAKDPRRLEWRAGLSRFYLERGERDLGVAVWDDYKQQAQRTDWLAAAESTSELGLEELARSFAEELIKQGKDKEPLAALQFLFDRHKARGRDEEMIAVLERMDALAAPDASERARIAESWEQLGRQDKAVGVLEKLREARGADNFSSDLETRLAWLYSETGAEEKALEAWKRVWLRIDSPGRLRYIEDRLMATASRLGKLADIAIELEEKLAAGTADKRDSALLVRLYSKVGDPVSAAEIIQDFMKQSGGTEISMLEEQARVYVMCNDYYHYEKTLRKLIELDPEGTSEYLTQLAMSSLERGRNDEAQAILIEMRGLPGNPASAEFEAGVLTIAGMHEEAAAAYWRGLAKNPERIDGYLLLGRALQTLGKAPQAVGMFQYLIENADKDDLFTIAVDGLLNMNNPQQGSSLSPETLRWTRRTILERLAGKEDKVYLFQLLGDLSEDLRDPQLMIRAQAETLPVAGERRTAQLRELMELARGGTKNKDDVLRFGRRLIGMGEIIPPQVYLNLGKLFLDNGDIRNAVKTFDKANDESDPGDYLRKVAATFESKGYLKSALRSYEKLLLTDPDDVASLLKTGEIKEQFGRDAEAVLAYRQALKILMEGQALFNFGKTKPAGTQFRYFSRNADSFDKYYQRALNGLLVTSTTDGGQVKKLMEDSLVALQSDLERVEKERATNPEIINLANAPRVVRRGQMIRRLALGAGHLAQARTVETLLLKAFPEDKTFLADAILTWDNWGYGRPARALIDGFPEHPGRDAAIQALTQGGGGTLQKIFQLLLRGDEAEARKQLREMERAIGSDWSFSEYGALVSIAHCLDDSEEVERLVRIAISNSPKSERLRTSISLLSIALPRLKEAQIQRLIAHIENLLREGGTQAASGVQYFAYGNLKRLTGGNLKIPAVAIQPEIERMLAQGGFYTRSIGQMFAFLTPEDFRLLLRETYRKAKLSDRLGLLFGLLRHHPGKMDQATEDLLAELIEEASKANLDNPLGIYKSAAQNSMGGSPNHPNTDFEARVLGKFASRTQGEQQLGFLAEEALVWQRAGNTQRALQAAMKLLDLAINDEKAFASFMQLQANLPPTYLDVFLSNLDEIESGSWPTVELEKKRLLLANQSSVPGRKTIVLREAVRKFPKELFFYEELRKELEKEGRHREAISILEELVKLAPETPRYRAELSEAWKKLAQPIKARAFAQASTADASPASRPAPKTAPTVRRPATVTAPIGQGLADGQEKSIPEPDTQRIQRYIKDGDIDQARLELRKLWRRFSDLEHSCRVGLYNNYTAAHSRYYEWPQVTAPPPRTAPPATTSGGANPGGLRGFLGLEPIKLNNPLRRTAPPMPSIFHEIGSEDFVAGELELWLRIFDPREYQGAHFEEFLRGIVANRIAREGVGRYLGDAFARHAKGELSALDRHALLTALELQPEAGGEQATAFLKETMESLETTVTWQTLRLARCLLKRGDEKSALSLYRWCVASVNFSVYTSSNSLTASSVIEEIRRNFQGESRLRVLKEILPLITHDNRSEMNEAELMRYILNIWSEELPVHQVYESCPDMCRKIIKIFETTSDPKMPAMDIATLFLAAGGETQEALKALPLLLKTRTVSGKPIPRVERDYFLQIWLPEDMGAWNGADRWLAGFANQVLQWESERKLSTPESVKMLSLVAVRQHQNRFAEAARKTLADIRNLSFTDTDAALWFLDAAEITRSDDLAMAMATQLLNERRLPIARVAPLMKVVAEKQGLPAALELAESALELTWERGFIETMARLCTQAGDLERARLWNERLEQAWGDRSSADAAAREMEEAYRLSVIGRESAGADDERGASPGDDPFERMARATTETLLANPLLKAFDHEIFVARPFVILMTRSPDATPEANEARKRRIEDLARGIWRNWLQIRADWELRSTREDTPESPEPFVWLAFHDENAYGQYMIEARRGKGTAGSRAFYSTETGFVSFHEDPTRDPSIITIHETFHQLMDRYSQIPSTKYRNYCFTEGLPEYFAGHRGSGETLVLGELNRPRRAAEIRRIRTHFDDGRNISYPQHERDLQITPDDWVFFDVPMLLTLRDPMWFKGISAALAEQFRRSAYAEKDFCKDFIRDGETEFHSAFYAYAWAFTYWLIENYPEQYRRYAMTVLNTDQGGDAESFLAAFNIRPVRPLPDIERLVGPDNSEVVANQKAAVACIDARIHILRQTPVIQEMHRRWVEWMKLTFPKLPQPGEPTADEAYRQLRAAAEAKQDGRTLELGEAFLRTHSESPEIPSALHLAAMAAMESSRYARAAPLFRQIIDDHPDFENIGEVRFKLAECLAGMRALDECIAHCRASLAAEPDDVGADYLQFLIPQSQFRLWRFREAEQGLNAFLAEYPDSSYSADAQRYLDMINPPWTVDANGIAPYSGKYAKDERFQAALAVLPEYIRQAREMNRQLLGTDFDFAGTVNFIFRDAGEDSRGGLMAETFTICRDYKPVTVIQFYAEHVVIEPESYRTTVTHELKHAGFKNVMGLSYNDLPEWIIEGLAQWAAGQLDWRLVSALNSETFSGKDPAGLANGVANPRHDLGDYLEDVLAFEWMERQKPGSVREFATGLIEGNDWSALLAKVTGLRADQALSRMDLHVKERIESAIGPAGWEALALRDTQIAKGKEGAEVLGKWLREEGNRGYADWLENNPEHILRPVIRFYHGRGLILAGDYARGRASLRGLIDSSEVTTLADDALFWEGYAFQQEKRMADAERSFGILLRDYSWSGNAARIRGGFKPAGPELGAVADPSYNPKIDKPSFPIGQGPMVAIDEGHHNHHTRTGRYAPFAKLLAADGYQVRSHRGTISARSLDGVDILVIANALHPGNIDKWELPTPSAFYGDEIDTIVNFVDGGGSLFLVADHMPFPGAAEELAARFGVRFENGFNASKDGTDALLPGSVDFRREGGGIAPHPITDGANPDERIDQVKSFTGSAFQLEHGTSGASPLLVLGPGSYLLSPNRAWDFTGHTPRKEAEGWLQGAALEFGKGRIVVFAEAAMFTAQRTTSGRIGMQTPGARDNQQLALNVLRWLNPN